MNDNNTPESNFVVIGTTGSEFYKGTNSEEAHTIAKEKRASVREYWLLEPEQPLVNITDYRGDEVHVSSHRITQSDLEAIMSLREAHTWPEAQKKLREHFKEGS